VHIINLGFIRTPWLVASIGKVGRGGRRDGIDKSSNHDQTSKSPNNDEICNNNDKFGTQKIILVSLVLTSAVSWLLLSRQSDADNNNVMMRAMMLNDPISLSLFTATWTVGMAAMMFPTITSMILLYNRVIGGGGNATQKQKQADENLMVDPKNTFVLTNKAAILDRLGNHTTTENTTNFLQYENSTYGLSLSVMPILDLQNSFLPKIACLILQIFKLLAYLTLPWLAILGFMYCRWILYTSMSC
jgi:hypothetical protein